MRSIVLLKTLSEQSCVNREPQTLSPKYRTSICLNSRLFGESNGRYATQSIHFKERINVFKWMNSIEKLNEKRLKWMKSRCEKNSFIVWVFIAIKSLINQSINVGHYALHLCVYIEFNLDSNVCISLSENIQFSCDKFEIFSCIQIDNRSIDFFSPPKRNVVQFLHEIGWK